MLIPGHMGTALSWRFQVEDLGRDRQIVVAEEHVNLPSMRAMAADIAGRLPPRFDLAAWSMGGYVAFELLPLVRGRVRKTVLIHTSARPDTPATSAARRSFLLRMQTEPPPQVFRQQLLRGLWDAARVDPHFLEAIIAENLRLGSGTLEQQITALIGRADSRPSLATAPGAFLIVAGRHDTVVPVAAAEEITALLPAARLHVFEDAGHFSPWEKPRELNALMRDFLE